MNITASANVRKILDACLKIESCAADLYAYFEKAYSDYPDLAALWKKTAGEEELHVNQFRLAIKMHSQIIKEVAVDYPTVLNLLRDLELYFEQVKTHLPSTRSALETAINFENNLAEYHMKSAAVFHDDSYAQLFKAMMAADQNHVTALQNALDTLKK